MDLLIIILKIGVVLWGVIKLQSNFNIKKTTTVIFEFFTISDLAVSVRSGRSKSEFYVCFSVDTWHLKIQVHSRTGILSLFITLYISTTSKNYNSYLPDLAETAKFLITKN